VAADWIVRKLAFLDGNVMQNLDKTKPNDDRGCAVIRSCKVLPTRIIQKNFHFVAALEEDYTVI